MVEKISITTKDDIYKWMEEFVVEYIVQEGEDPNIYHSEIEEESAGAWSFINDDMLHAVFLDYENSNEVTMLFRSFLCKIPYDKLFKLYEWCLKINEELKIKHLSLYNDEIILNDSFIIHSVDKDGLFDKLEGQANISSLVKYRMVENFNIRDRSPYEDLTIPPNTSLLFKIPKEELN